MFEKAITTLTILAYVLTGCSTQNPNNNGGNSTSMPSVTICNQVWSIQNLNVSRYRNGDSIPEVRDSLAWANLTIGAWCWYNNDSVNYSQYGKLYNWYAVNDPRGLAPTGWHIPSHSDWKKLVICINPSADTIGLAINGCILDSIVGTSLKSNTGWNNNGNGTNSSGFTALPGGARSGGYDGYGWSRFIKYGRYGDWWSANEFNVNNAFCSEIMYYNGGFVTFESQKSYGYSVRLIKD